MQEGHVIIESFESNHLKENPLKDPYLRKIAIYLPPQYANSNQKFPVLFCLPGFAGSGLMFLNHEPFAEAFHERLNRLILTQKIKPMVVVMPDCFTYYGGSQYIDSVATGNYKTHLIEELVPYIRKKFQVLEDPASWAIMGKSSGGYGALMLAMQHPEIFGICACHSGDMGFEYCYLPDFPQAMVELEKNNGITKFMQNFYEKSKKTAADFLTLNIIAMGAAYSPNISLAPHYIDLPFDLSTGELRNEIWQKWLNYDPINLINLYRTNLQKIKIFMDCGLQDEFRLYAGARIFTSKLKNLEIDFAYEEFEDTHMKINYRYDFSLQFISEFISQ